MITLDWIYVIEGMVISVYTKQDITLATLLERSASQTLQFVLCLKMPDDYFGGPVNYPHVCVDGSTYMQEQARFGTKDWDDLISQFTYAQVKAYQSERFGFSTEGPTLQYTESIYYVTKGYAFTPHYCNMKDPTVRDAPMFRWNMPDLVISKHQKSDCHLDHCIPVIDGKVFRPMYHEGELYVKEGARQWWYSDNQKGTEVFLIDTTVLGDLSIIDYKNCKLHYKNPVNERRDNCRWELQLPDTHRLDTYTVLPVIQGILYLPSQYTKTSLTSIAFHPQTWPHTRGHHLYRTGDSWEQRTTVSHEDCMMTLQEEALAHPENNFLICIKNPQIYIHKSDVCRWIDYGMYLTTGACGLFRHKTAGTLRAYTKSSYSSFSLLSTDHRVSRVICQDTKTVSLGIDEDAVPAALKTDHAKTDCECFHLVSNRLNGVRA